MPKRWSKLQTQINELMDPSIDFQIHLSKYRMDSQYGSTDLPRYWITIGKEIVFDYPKDFVSKEKSGPVVINLDGRKSYYPYQTDISKISDLIREYIDTPKDELLSKSFENDHWGMTDLLKAADKRIGKRQLRNYKETVDNEKALKIVNSRLGSKEGQGE